MKRAVSVRAPAKINLGLEVLRKRPDGYHELLTILQTIRLADTVRIQRTDPYGDSLDPLRARRAKTGSSSLDPLRARRATGAGSLDPLRVRRAETGASSLDPLRVGRMDAGRSGSRSARVTLAVRFSGAPEVDLGPVEGNLAVRAARAYRDAAPSPAQREAPLAIELTKRIPVGAGLGGGSSDAAAVLVGLTELLGPLASDPSEHRARLHALTAGLGSDVPFFLEGGTQLGSGRGEIVTPIAPWAGGPMVVVYPNVSLPTSSIYRRLRLPLTPPGPLATMAPRDNPRVLRDRAWRSLRNDLQDVVVEQAPAVGKVLEELQALGAVFARVTGSGSAVFALASSDSEASRWAKRFRSNGCWARATGPSQSGCRLLRRARS